MSNILERAKNHYIGLAEQGIIIEVPEWKDEHGNATILHASPMTLDNKAFVKKHAKNEPEIAVEILLLKCKDADGKPVFSREHKYDLLRHVQSSVIERIANQILGDDDLEQAEKN